MKHVDETVLHALLDGQLEALEAAGALPAGIDRGWIENHTRTCAECRALLEAERQIRDQASLVLRDAALATVDVPPFEMVAHEPPTVPVPRRNLIPLAWAATVILALGAGWWGSILLRQEQPTVALEQAAPSAATGASRAAAADAARNAASPVEDAVASDVGDDYRPAATAAASRAADGAATGLSPQSGRTERTLAASEPAMTDVDASTAARPPGTAPAADPAVSADEPRMAAAALPEITVTSVPAAPGRARLVPEPATSVAARRAGDERSAQRFQAESGRITQVEPAEDTAPPQAFHDAVEAARQQQLAWTSVDQTDPGVAGITLVKVAGLSPLEVEYAHLANGGVVSRVIQLLDDGVRLELLIWRSATGSAGTPAAVAAQTKAETAGLPVTVVSSTDSPAGQDLLAYVPSLDAFVLLSGDLERHRLLALADRLIVP